MTHAEGPVLSVRGQARRVVPPDSAAMFGALEAFDSSKQAVLATAARAFERIAKDLRHLGGVVHQPDTDRHPLTWSARAIATHPEYTHNFQTQRPEETGRIVANLSVQLIVRDFDLLDALGDRLAEHNLFNIHFIHWRVDDDNPGWPLVRADAIQAAMRQGRDYAAALATSLLRVEHVADAGLLGDGGQHVTHGGRAMGADASAAAGGGPSLDPVPQELTATIEARFSTRAVDLPPEPRPPAVS